MYASLAVRNGKQRGVISSIARHVEPRLRSVTTLLMKSSKILAQSAEAQNLSNHHSVEVVEEKVVRNQEPPILIGKVDEFIRIRDIFVFGTLIRHLPTLVNISLFGKRLMGLYRKVGTFITLMEFEMIIGLKIFKQCLGTCIKGFMLANTSRSKFAALKLEFVI